MSPIRIQDRPGSHLPARIQNHESEGSLFRDSSNLPMPANRFWRDTTEPLAD